MDEPRPNFDAKKIEILASVEPGLRRRFCQFLGVSRSSFYQPPEPNAKDAAAGNLEAAHLEHPFYGVRRLSLHLGWSAKKTRPGSATEPASSYRRLPSAGVIVRVRPKRRRRRISSANTPFSKMPAGPKTAKTTAV